jgi:hypothetical protein
LARKSDRAAPTAIAALCQDQAMRQDPAAQICLDFGRHERGQHGRFGGGFQFAEECQPVVLQRLVERGFFGRWRSYERPTRFGCPAPAAPGSGRALAAQVAGTVFGSRIGAPSRCGAPTGPVLERPAEHGFRYERRLPRRL